MADHPGRVVADHKYDAVVLAVGLGQFKGNTEDSEIRSLAEISTFCLM